MDWQPIETAPKDGSRILVFCVHKGAIYYELDTKLSVYGAHCECFGGNNREGVAFASWGGE